MNMTSVKTKQSFPQLEWSHMLFLFSLMLWRVKLFFWNNFAFNWGTFLSWCCFYYPCSSHLVLELCVWSKNSNESFISLHIVSLKVELAQPVFVFWVCWNQERLFFFFRYRDAGCTQPRNVEWIKVFDADCMGIESANGVVRFYNKAVCSEDQSQVSIYDGCTGNLVSCLKKTSGKVCPFRPM